MKRFFMFFLFIFNSFKVIGEEINEYEGKKLNISKNIYILEDKTKDIKEEDIIKGLYDHRFEINKNNLIYLLNSNSIYYIKIRIKNLSSKESLDLYGWLRSLTLSRTDITCIYLENNKLIKKKFTQKIHEKDQQDLLNYAHASFNISNKEMKTIYIKIKAPLITPLILTEIENIVKEEKIYFFINSMFIGMALLIFVIIFLSYLSLRKNYLLYYILMFLFTYLKSRSLAFFLASSENI